MSDIPADLEERCIARRFALLESDPFFESRSEDEKCERYCVAYMLGVYDARDIRRAHEEKETHD